MKENSNTIIEWMFRFVTPDYIIRIWYDTSCIENIHDREHFNSSKEWLRQIINKEIIRVFKEYKEDPLVNIISNLCESIGTIPNVAAIEILDKETMDGQVFYQNWE